MAASTKLKQKFNGSIVSYTPKLYIKDAGVKSSTPSTGYYTRPPEWVDFSDRTEQDGKNLLTKITSIQHVTEERAGTSLSYSKISSLSLDNSSGFFNKPFLATLTTINGSTAVWNTTKNGKLSNIYNHQAQIRIVVTMSNGAIEEATLGTFIITGVQRSLTSPEIKIKMSDLSQPLRVKNGAERVTDGLGWYQNRPIKMLLEELLRERYFDKTGTAGNLPTTYRIPDTIDIPTAGTTQGLSIDVRALSHVGRPPDQDVSGSWLNRSMITRAMVYVPTTSTNLTSGLYIGCENDSQAELWRYDRAADNYTQITSGGSNWYEALYFVWRIWYDTSRDEIVFVAIQSSTITAEDSRKTTAKFYKYDGTTVTELETVSDVFMGDFSFRAGGTGDWLWYKARAAGYWPGIGQAGENMAIPFKQRIIQVGLTPSAVFHGILTLGNGTKIVNAKFDNTTTGSGATRELEGGQYVSMILFRDTSNPPPAGFRYTMGQSGFCVYNQEHNTIVYTTVTENGTRIGRVYADIQINICAHNVATATSNTVHSDVRENSQRVDFMCGCSGGPTNTNKDYVFMGGVAWYQTADTRARTYLYKLNLSSGVKTKFYDSNSESDSTVQNNFTPIWMAWNDHTTATNPLLKIISFNRDTMKSTPYNLYSVIVPQSDAGSPQVTLQTMYGKNTFRHQPTALTFDSNNRMYFVVNGQLYKYECYGSGAATGAMERPILCDYGWAAVTEEQYTSVDELAIDEESRGTGNSAIIWGVSSPSPSVYGSLNSRLDGKYYLWKYDTYLSGRIELADFSGMSRWDAIENLSMIAGYHAGFDVEGNFIFVNDTQASSTDLTLENSADYNRVSKMSIDSNEKEVYNLVDVAPNDIILGEPSVDVTLIPRSKDDDAEDSQVHRGTVVISQRDTRKKRIQLKSISDGKLSDQTIYFKYRVFGETFETTLREATQTGDDQLDSGDPYLKIRSGVNNVSLGDAITVISELNGDEQEEEFEVIEAPSETDKNSGLVRVASQHASASSGKVYYEHPVNSYVEVNKAYDKWSDQEDNLVLNSGFEDWTDDTLVTVENWTVTDSDMVYYNARPFVIDLPFSTSSGLLLGSSVFSGRYSLRIKAKTSKAAGGTGGVYQTIPKDRLKADTTYAIWAFVRTDPGSEQRAESEVRLEVKSGAPGTYSSLSDATNWTDVDVKAHEAWSLVAGTFKTPTSGGVGDQSSEDITIGLLVKKPANALPTQTTFILVDSVYVKEGRDAMPDYILATEYNHNYPVANTGIEVMFQWGSPEFMWRTGDILEVNCPGLELKKQEQNISRTRDMVSMSIYGEKEFPSINNPFINARLADALSRRLCYDYRYPHYKIKVTVPLLPWVNFINDDGLLYRIDLYDDRMFKESGGWKETCYVQGIVHNLSNNTTTLTLRATAQY